MRSLILGGGLALALAGTIVLAQQSQPADSPQAKPTFAAGGTAVMVDVVVRDKSGKPVTDLRSADFELYEDDVRQEIGDLALVAPPNTVGAGGIPTTPAGAPNATSNTVSTPTFVALAFDRLSPEGRALAYKGAQAYLDTARDNDFAGVFVVDNSLQTIHTYTTDRASLKKAIDEAATARDGELQQEERQDADRSLRRSRSGDVDDGERRGARARDRRTPTNPGGTSASPRRPGQGSPRAPAGCRMRCWCRSSIAWSAATSR